MRLWPEILDGEALNQRRAICADCDRNKAGFCSECACIVAVKTHLKQERCPLGKWESIKFSIADNWPVEVDKEDKAP